MNTDYFALAVAEARKVFQPVPVESRDCPTCDRPAWLSEIGPDGLRSFMCSHGHLLIVAASGSPEGAK